MDIHLKTMLNPVIAAIEARQGCTSIRGADVGCKLCTGKPLSYRETIIRLRARASILHVYAADVGVPRTFAAEVADLMASIALADVLPPPTPHMDCRDAHLVSGASCTVSNPCCDFPLTHERLQKWYMYPMLSYDYCGRGPYIALISYAANLATVRDNMKHESDVCEELDSMDYVTVAAVASAVAVESIARYPTTSQPVPQGRRDITAHERTLRQHWDGQATIWTYIARLGLEVGRLSRECTKVEFYASMVMRSGIPPVHCKTGEHQPDGAALLQVQAQLSSLVVSYKRGDVYGACYLLQGGDMEPPERCAAVVAATRYYTCCAPSRMGAACITAGLYGLTSSRHARDLWHLRGFMPMPGEAASRERRCGPSLAGCLAGRMIRCHHVCAYPPVTNAFRDLILAIGAMQSYTDCSDWYTAVARCVVDVDRHVAQCQAEGRPGEALYGDLCEAAGAYCELVEALLDASLKAVAEQKQPTSAVYT